MPGAAVTRCLSKDNRAFGVELAFNYTDGTKQSYVRNFRVIPISGSI